MTIAHATAVHEIESHSFADPWPLEEILFDLSQEHAICFVALQDNRVVGFVIMRHIADEGHICNLATHKNHRNKGIGSKLCNALVTEGIARNLYGLTLEVRVSNAPALAVYEKYGFKVTGYRQGYYQHPTEDAAIMWKYL